MAGSIVLLLVLAVAAPWLVRVLRAGTGWLLGTSLLAMSTVFWRHVPMAAGTDIIEIRSWVPTLGVELAFRLDGLSLTFAILISLIGALVLIYGGGYLGGDERAGRFFGFVLFFIASMLGLVLSDNVIALFVFWELTSVSSYLLIGLDHEKEESRKAALKALVVTATGGVVLVAGFVLMRLAGLDLGLDAAASWRLSELASVDLRGHPWYTAIALLIFAGAFTKSAQVPFHFWLPAAMAAPTPVSALLHSATMVKAGVFLLARLHPAMGQTMLWEVVVTAVGAATMVTGALLAVAHTDLKKILAYSTVSVLGILTMLVGVGTEMAIKAMVVFLVAHALYKAALFLIAGNLDHGTGTREVASLGGLRALLPFTAAAGVLSALSMAGAPPMFGFIGKELLYKAKLDLESVATCLIVVAVAANILLVATALQAGIKPFFGRRIDTPHEPHEAPPSMLLGPMFLAASGLAVGLFPAWFDRALGEAMAASVAGYGIEMKSTLWHGINPAALTVLALSAVTVILGITLFVRLPGISRRLAHLAARAGQVGPDAGFVRGLDGTVSFSLAVTRRIQSGYLRRYLRVVIVVMAAGILVPAVGALARSGLPAAGGVSIWEGLTAALMISGAVVAASSRQPLTSVAALGTTGLGVAMLFVYFSAPDLAITQIMVETLTVILLALVLYRMKKGFVKRRRNDRTIDLGVAIGAGLAVTVAFLAAAASAGPSRLSSWFAATSAPEAFGRNVVNVILVDFRALDTLGEITVVAVAGVGVYALLKGWQFGAKGDRP
jgi:multicomponent Na+:H+ antiporter subunit A